jgi:acetyltransferase-like isoleucine patch superfamily enzyme
MRPTRSLRARLLEVRARHWLRNCHHVGDGVVLDGRPTVIGDGTIRIGDRFHLASRPVASHLIAGRGAAVTIGDDVSIGHGAAIAGYAGIAIGARTRIGPNAIIIDTDFHVVGNLAARPEPVSITIGRDVRIGSRVIVLRGSHVSDGVAIAAGSVVRGVVPEGARVAGVPARVTAPSDATPPNVPEVVMRSFGLASLPGNDSGPHEIPYWDSLGSLNLLLALEEAFDVVLDEKDLAKAATVGEVSNLLNRALARGSRVAPKRPAH